MKFKINRNLFIEKLGIASKIIVNKSNFPALSCILIECKEQTLTLTTSNDEISIKTIIESSELNIESDGMCLIPSKKLVELVRKVDSEDIEVELEKDDALRIQAGSTDALLNLWDIEDYPNINFYLDTESVKIKSSLLKELIRQTSFACISTEGKAFLAGVNFKIEGTHIAATATDSFRLSKRDAELDEPSIGIDVIIQSRVLNELDKILENNDEIIELYFMEDKMLAKCNSAYFLATLLKGKYPNVSSLLVSIFPIVIKFNKNDLINSVDIASTLSSAQGSSIIIDMEIDENGNVVLSSNSQEAGNVKRKVNCIEAEVTGPVSLSFSAPYLLDALRTFNADEVYFKYGSGTGSESNARIKKLVLESDEDPGLIEIVLPLRTKN